jgi:hypothetical protein
MVVAVAAMSIATTATYVITSGLRENMSERLLVEDVWFNNSTHTVDVYLRNIGKVTVHVVRAYVNHTLQAFNSPLDLEIGKPGWLNISYAWGQGSLCHVDIVTNRGTHVEGYYKAP